MIGTMLRLAAQLGPFGPRAERFARQPLRQWDVTVDAGAGRRFPMRMLIPRRPAGALLVAPGLHYAGPADPRMHAFITQLAGSGILVGAPFLPDFCDLALAPTLISDFSAAYQEFVARLPPRRRGVWRVGVFSISFGSLPALRLASNPEFASQVSGVVTFGGYADWTTALRFSLTGESPDPNQPKPPHDPLNQPVIFMNLLESMPGDIAPPRLHAPLREAWRRYIRSTWGRPEMKAPERYRPVAQAIAGELPANGRELFLMACGIAPGGLELALAALEQSPPRDFLDPRPAMQTGLKAPLHLIHGADDDVIPPSEMRRLAASAPAGVRVRTYLTGLYSHTHAEDAAGPGALVRELRTMLGMLGGIAEVATGR